MMFPVELALAGPKGSLMGSIRRTPSPSDGRARTREACSKLVCQSLNGGWPRAHAKVAFRIEAIDFERMPRAHARRPLGLESKPDICPVPPRARAKAPRRSK